MFEPPLYAKYNPHLSNTASKVPSSCGVTAKKSATKTVSLESGERNLSTPPSSSVTSASSSASLETIQHYSSVGMCEDDLPPEELLHGLPDPLHPHHRVAAGVQPAQVQARAAQREQHSQPRPARLLCEFTAENICYFGRKYLPASSHPVPVVHQLGIGSRVVPGGEVVTPKHGE